MGLTLLLLLGTTIVETSTTENMHGGFYRVHTPSLGGGVTPKCVQLHAGEGAFGYNICLQKPPIFFSQKSKSFPLL